MNQLALELIAQAKLSPFLRLKMKRRPCSCHRGHVLTFLQPKCLPNSSCARKEKTQKTNINLKVCRPQLDHRFGTTNQKPKAQSGSRRTCSSEAKAEEQARNLLSQRTPPRAIFFLALETPWKWKSKATLTDSCAQRLDCSQMSRTEVPAWASNQFRRWTATLELDLLTKLFLSQEFFVNMRLPNRTNKAAI